MIRTTFKCNFPRRSDLSARSDCGQPAKTYWQLRRFLGKFWQFSLYYGEFIGNRSHSQPPSRGERTR